MSRRGRRLNVEIELENIKEHLWAIENNLERLKEHLKKLEELLGVVG